MLPETNRNHKGYIATETIDICVFHPVFHGINHGFTQLRIVIIQISCIFPICSFWLNNISQTILCVPIRMRFYPHIIPRSVICHPINNHMHSQFMCFCNQVFEISFRSVFRIYSRIIFYCIIASEFAFAVFLSNRIDGHHPDNVNTHCL